MFKRTLQQSIERSWQSMAWFTPLLLPLSLIYAIVMWVRKVLYQTGLFRTYTSPVPVIVVGNLTVGGTGKTPLVIYLVEQLRANGYRPGVISRGYGGSARAYPLFVSAATSALESGDEAALIARQTRAPVAVGPRRQASIEMLLQEHNVNVIVSDDGLQHLALARDIEVCVTGTHARAEISFDAVSDNTFLLPAGPYRESVARLKSVDFVVANSVIRTGSRSNMNLEPSAPKPLRANNGQQFDPADGVHAVAGIGHPERFFKTCEGQGWQIIRHIFPDHHAFRREDIQFNDSKPVIMTSKDAVKCVEFADDQHWELPVNAKLDPEFFPQVLRLLEQL